MGSLSTRFPSFLTDCCIAAGAGVLLVVLLPLLALAAFTLRPMILLAAFVGLVLAMCGPITRQVRRRTPDDPRTRSARREGRE